MGESQDLYFDFSGNTLDNDDGSSMRKTILDQSDFLLKGSKKYLLDKIGEFTSGDNILGSHEKKYIEAQLSYHRKLKEIHDNVKKNKPKECLSLDIKKDFDIFQTQFLSRTHLSVLGDDLKNIDTNKCISDSESNIDEKENEYGEKGDIESGKLLDINENTFYGEVIDFIIGVEGFIEISKWDHGQYSWGYSTRAPKGGMKISKEKAMEELSKKVNEILIGLNKEPWFKKLNKNQKISLISFFYNVGLSKKGKEHLMYRLRNGYNKAVTNIMLEYKNAGGNHNNGLYERRKKEVDKFWS